MTGPGRTCLVCVLCVAAAIAARAQTFETLASFYGTAYPQYVSLAQGADGNFYGTTAEGGGDLWGTLFEVTAAGELTTLCWFGEDTCYGRFPYSGVIQATDGDLYGTTWQGGATSALAYGTVYKTPPSVNDLTLLYSFCSQTNCSDGADPFAPLVQAANGNFYGTTFNGGTSGYGTVFAITSAGTLTTLHSFGCSDGAGPVAGLIQAKDGNFYGTTLYGGATGGGAVFEMTAAGTLTTLYSFCSRKNCADGAHPYAGHVQATDGNLRDNLRRRSPQPRHGFSNHGRGRADNPV